MKLLPLLPHLTLASATAVSSVTIQNWSGPNCKGNALECTNVSWGYCCYTAVKRRDIASPLIREFQSSKFLGTSATDLGAVCEKGMPECHHSKMASHGPDECISRTSKMSKEHFKGSFWLPCEHMRWPICHYAGFKVEDKPPIMELETLGGDQAFVPVGTVLPDKVVIDGHGFELNHPNQTQETTDTLEALMDVEGIKYEEIHPDLLRWEVKAE